MAIMTFKAMIHHCGWLRLFDAITYTVHVIPVNDDKEHEHINKCWCNPYLSDYNEWIHVSKDGRESYEEGRPLH